MDHKIILFVPPKYIIGKSILNIKEKPKKTKPKILNLIKEMNNST